MGTSLLAELLESFKKFHLISASNNVKHDTVQRYCKTIDQILEHFKPVCYEIAASEISLDEQLVNMLKELDAAVIEAGDLLESWHSMISKINFVLQIETLVIKISSSTLKISELVTPLLPSPIDSTILKCIEETQYTNELKISAVIEKAIMDQKENNRSSPEDLDKISNFLNLSSNQDLLMEIIALEKLRAEVSCSETQEEVEKIDHIIALVAYMHDCLLQVKQLHSINGVPIPTDFCCPLSLELMSDPVIVASGQTYERAFIRKWLDDGFNVCPRTHQTLGHTNLIPNYTVKALIANWCELNDIKLPDPVKSMGLNIPSVSLKPTEASVPEFILPHSGSSAQINHQRSPEHGKVITSERDAYPSNGVYHATSLHLGSDSSPVQIVNGSDPSISKLSLVSTARNKEPSLEQRNIISGGQSTYQSRQDSEPSTDDERSPCHKRTESAPNAVSRENVQRPGNADQLSRVSSDLTHYNSDASGEIAQNAISSSSQREPEFVPPLDEVRPRNHNIWRRPTVPRIISMESRSDLSDVESEVRKLIEDLKSDAVDTLRTATEEIRLLAKHNMENRIVIANCGAISLLVGLLHSTDFKTQENAVTALLNLSINDNNKIAIANANAIDPLIYVLETGNSEAKENSAATLFSLSVIEENKVKIGRSGAIKPLVDLLANGTPRGKKDAATALFNLSIFHENKSRIVQAGAVRHLVELMDPAAGMVDKAVAVLANLATIPEGRTAIGQANGIPVLVEVVELGSARGKENAAAALLQLCTNSGRFCSQVLQEGAVPPLVALSQSGTPRAKEKTQALLSYFRNQRHANAGRRL